MDAAANPASVVVWGGFVLAFLVIGAVMMLFVRTNAAPSSG